MPFDHDIQTPGTLPQVIEGNYCVGCGACAVASQNVSMELNEYGCFVPQIDLEENLEGAARVCPFTGQGINEDEIGAKFFGPNLEHDSRIGFYSNVYGGHVKADDYREKGSSGGMGSWLLAELLERGMVNRIIHVERHAPSQQDRLLFRYSISESVEELRTKSKSHYYPVELSQVMQQVQQVEGNYAVVGVPCYLKAVRLLCMHNLVLQERIKYCIGLVCGHMKSTHFASNFAWQAGIHPHDLESIDFRVKLEGEAANKYGVQVTQSSGKEKIEVVRQNKTFFGYLWGHGFFKNIACEFCDDVLAETADVTIGDAWLPQYVDDSMGTNLVIVRRHEINELLLEAEDAGELKLDHLTAEDAANSQAAGLRHRREGLQYRIWKCQSKSIWHPPKRVSPDRSHISRRYRKIFDMRTRLSQESHRWFRVALENNDYSIFEREMRKLIHKYNVIYSGRLRSGLRMIKHALKKFVFRKRNSD